MKIIGSGLKIVDKLKVLQSNQLNNKWKITYVSLVHGGWDLIVECCFKELQHLREIIQFCRDDNELSEIIEATTTLIGIKNDFNF